MRTFLDGTSLSNEEVYQLQNELVEVLRKHTTSVLAANFILDSLELDTYSTLRNVRDTLPNIPTEKLSNELQKRRGIRTFVVQPYEQIKITVGDQQYTSTGPAVIHVNQD